MKSRMTISPKLAAAVAPPLTAVVTAMILNDVVDRTSLAALAAILIGAVLGYHAPAGAVKASPPAAPVPSNIGFSTTASIPASTVGSTSWTPMPVVTGDADADPALDDPAHPDEEPEITDADLEGRNTEAVTLDDHTGLGDDA